MSRAQFEQNLHDKESDPAFLGDIKPLLAPTLTTMLPRPWLR